MKEFITVVVVVVVLAVLWFLVFLRRRRLRGENPMGLGLNRKPDQGIAQTEARKEPRKPAPHW